MALDPLAATAALIDSLGAQSLAKAASHTAGNHWLLLWNLVIGGLIAWAVVRSGLLDRLDARLGRRGANTRAFAAGAVYFPVSALLALPWSLYAEWWRERDYGRTSHPLADFLGQAVLSTLISSVVGTLTAITMISFLLADRLFPSFARLFGSGAALPDPRGLPVVIFMVSLFLLLATPVMSALSRFSERASDRYSLETVDLPDALATALVKTAEYRDPRPHPLQEALFYTHPSVERRVLAAMQWKASKAAGGSRPGTR